MSYLLVVDYNETTQQFSVMNIDNQETPAGLVHWGWDHFSQQPIYADFTLPLPNNKFDSNGNHIRKTQFETELALAVFENETLFLPLLKKIAEAMVNFLERQLGLFTKANCTEEFITLAGEIFTEYLFEDKSYFGRVSDSAPISSKEAYQTGLNILNSGNTIEHLLTAIMAADTISGETSTHQAIANNFDIKDMAIILERYRLRDIFIHESDLLHHQGRLERETSINLTTQFGITDNSKDVSYELPLHERAIQRYMRDVFDVTDFVSDAYKREIPFVSGPSGHTAKLLYSAMSILSFNNDELKMYVLACAGFIIGAGAHSFHEIYSVAKLVGVDYDSGRYEASIPTAFQQTASFKKLAKKFSDIIRVADINLIEEKSDLNQHYFFSTKRPLAPTGLLAEEKKYSPDEAKRNSGPL